MNHKNHCKPLLDYQKQTMYYEQIQQQLSWDKETFLPQQAINQRKESLALIKTTIHERNQSKELGELIEQAESSQQPTHEEQRQIELIKKKHQQSMAIPKDLAKALSQASTDCCYTWSHARDNAELRSVYLDQLNTVIQLTQAKAQALQAYIPKACLYDQCLNQYEDGCDTKTLDDLFLPLKDASMSISTGVMIDDKKTCIPGNFNETQQMAFCEHLAKQVGYDMKRGRLDRSAHPFTIGHANDVRITTRFSPDNLLPGIYSTLHEVGHALYEQNINPAYYGSCLGQGVSMGIHESQSRLLENQIGRSRAFCEYLSKQASEFFPDLKINGETWYQAANQVTPNLIRTESDECQYNCHIILRYELEKALIQGDLSTTDIEYAWNGLVDQYFQQKNIDPKDGFCQDIHWSMGHFGYFPTYALGNIYGAMFFETIQQSNDQLESELAAGDVSTVTGCLKQHIHTHGSLYTPKTLCQRIGVETISTQPLINYLQTKYKTT